MKRLSLILTVILLSTISYGQMAGAAGVGAMAKGEALSEAMEDSAKGETKPEAATDSKEDAAQQSKKVNVIFVSTASGLFVILIAVMAKRRRKAKEQAQKLG